MYNPFQKSLHEIEAQDLQLLIDNEIAESWYIEYKSKIPETSNGKLDASKIAKSVSSFANTRGGWIFWGIECNQNYPDKIDGIDVSSYDNFEDTLSRIINYHINPKPFYRFHRVKLENGKFVFIILIDEGVTPPYVSSKGVIYQRENNESKPLTDRYIVERLNDKAKEYYKSIEQFSKFDLPETKGQADWNQTYLELYLFPLPFDSFNFEKFYTSEFFQTVAARFYQHVDAHFDFGENVKIPLNFGFNSIYSSEDSLIIRPLTDQNLIYKSTTVELFRNGNLKFLIPLFEFDSKNIPEKYSDSKTMQFILDKHSPYHEVKQRGSYLLGRHIPPIPNLPPQKVRSENDFTHHIKFIDGLEIIFMSIIILSKYKAILEDADFDFERKIGFRVRITDCWRKFVFLDSDEYLERIKLYNIPISPKNEIEIPIFKNGDSYRLDLSTNDDSIFLARIIMEGLGLPDSAGIDFITVLEKAIAKINN